MAASVFFLTHGGCWFFQEPQSFSRCLPLISLVIRSLLPSTPVPAASRAVNSSHKNILEINGLRIGYRTAGAMAWAMND